MAKTKNFMDVLRQKLAKDVDLEANVELARFNATVARIIYAERKAANLTQGELAQRIGTKQSVISRLEDSDYDGHSLSMLQKVASALGKHVRIEFVDQVVVAPTTTEPAAATVAVARPTKKKLSRGKKR